MGAAGVSEGCPTVTHVLPGSPAGPGTHGCWGLHVQEEAASRVGAALWRGRDATLSPFPLCLFRSGRFLRARGAQGRAHLPCVPAALAPGGTAAGAWGPGPRTLTASMQWPAGLGALAAPPVLQCGSWCVVTVTAPRIPCAAGLGRVSTAALRSWAALVVATHLALTEDIPANGQAGWAAEDGEPEPFCCTLEGF